MTNRFIILDQFGGKLRTYATEYEAKNYLRNKPECTMFEVSLIDVCGECLF